MSVRSIIHPIGKTLPSLFRVFLVVYLRLTVCTIVVRITGVELTRVDGTDEVKEGGNVSLICRAYMFSGPPEWTCLNTDTGTMQDMDETKPPEGQ